MTLLNVCLLGEKFEDKIESGGKGIEEEMVRLATPILLPSSIRIKNQHHDLFTHIPNHISGFTN